MYTRFPSLIVKTGSSGSSYDSDAQAYFTAAGITDVTEKNLWNNFVIGCKLDGIYNKLKTFHPLLGDNLTKKSYNAINSALSTLSYVGSVTNISQGLLFNNSQSNFTVSGLDATNFGTGIYIRNLLNLVAYDYRMLLEAQLGVQIAQGMSSNSLYYLESSFNSNGFTFFTESNYWVLAIHSTVESSTPYTRFYSNEPTEVLSGVANTSVSSPVYFGDTYGLFKDTEVGCVYTSEGLTESQANTLHTRINTLMTGLGRNL